MTTLSLTMIRGDTKKIKVTTKDSEGNAFDLTGATVWFTVKESDRDPDGAAFFRKTNGSGITITDASGGKFDIDIDPADTRGERTDAYVCDIQIKTSDDKVRTPAKGTLTITRDVTHES